MSESTVQLDPVQFVQPGSRLFIDTNVFMDTEEALSQSRKMLFTRCQHAVLHNANPIIVPSKVIDELTKQSEIELASLTPGRRAAVQKAGASLPFLTAAAEQGLVRIDLGDPSNPYADDLFVELFRRADYDLCLLTSDTTLRLRIRLLAIGSTRRLVTGTLTVDGMISVEGDQSLYERGVRKLAKQRELLAGGTDPEKAEREIASLKAVLPEIKKALNLHDPVVRATNSSSHKRAARFKGADRTLSPVDIPTTGGTVFDTKGAESVVIGAHVGEGGEGRVYEVVGRSDLVVKIFDNAHRTQHRHAKLTLLVSRNLQHEGIALPKSVVANADGAFVGYTMPRASGRVLQATVMRPNRFRETYPDWTKTDLVDVCISFLEKVEYLHAHDILIGDIHPKNLLVAADKAVWIIDADSWQLGGYPCPVGTAMFTAPTMRGDFASRLRTNQEELFAVATMLFMVLNTGGFPYARAGTTDDITTLIADGRFAYQFRGLSDQDQPSGLWKYMWSHLPIKVKRMFWETFHHDGPRYRRRPTATEWLETFREYRDWFGGPSDFDPMSHDIYPIRFRARDENAPIKDCPDCGRRQAIVGEWDQESETYVLHERCFECSRKRRTTPSLQGVCKVCSSRAPKSSMTFGRCADCTEKANQLDPARLCADCRQPFISFSHVEWYERKNIPVPRRHRSIKDTPCPVPATVSTRPKSRPAQAPATRQNRLTRFIKSLFS